MKRLIQASGTLVIVSSGRLKPHTWHIPNGGKLAEPFATLLHLQGWRDELAIERHTPLHVLN